MKSIALTFAALAALTAAAHAQTPAKLPPAPPAHVQHIGGHKMDAAAKNPTGIYWDAATKHFRDKSGKTVTKAQAHKAGIKGPAFTPPSHPKKVGGPGSIKPTPGAPTKK